MQTTIADVGALFIMLEHAMTAPTDQNTIAAIIHGRTKLVSLLARVDSTLARAGVTITAAPAPALVQTRAQVAQTQTSVQTQTRTQASTHKRAQATTQPKTSVPRPIPLMPIPLTARLAILARNVTTFNDVQQDGNLYWVADADCFALRIAGLLLHGDIGTIYATARDGHKAIPCQYGANCNRRATCQYWHNPVSCGGNERRNWTVLSWMHGPRHGMRRIGNRATLEDDVAAARPADSRDLRLQAMHDLLCAIVTTSVTGNKN